MSILSRFLLMGALAACGFAVDKCAAQTVGTAQEIAQGLFINFQLAATSSPSGATGGPSEAVVVINTSSPSQPLSAYTYNNNAWNPLNIVLPSTAQGNIANLELAADSQGNYIAAWIQTDTTTGQNGLFYSILDSANQAWTAPATITLPYPVSSFALSGNTVQIAGNPGSRFTILAIANTSTAANSYFTQNLSLAGWSTPTPIFNADAPFYYSQPVIFDTTEAVAAAYVQIKPNFTDNVDTACIGLYTNNLNPTSSSDWISVEVNNVLNINMSPNSNPQVQLAEDNSAYLFVSCPDVQYVTPSQFIGGAYFNPKASPQQWTVLTSFRTFNTSIPIISPLGPSVAVNGAEGAPDQAVMIACLNKDNNIYLSSIFANEAALTSNSFVSTADTLNLNPNALFIGNQAAVIWQAFAQVGQSHLYQILASFAPFDNDPPAWNNPLLVSNNSISPFGEVNYYLPQAKVLANGAILSVWFGFKSVNGDDKTYVLILSNTIQP